jgi:hypothetical protein
MLAANSSNSCAAAVAVRADVALVGVGVEHEEGLGDVRGAFALVVAVAAHVPLAEAAHAMGIDGQ